MKIFRTTLACLFLTSTICNASSFSDTAIIKSHLKILTKTPLFRTYNNVSQLNETANYIKSIFSLYTDSISFQEYLVDRKEYKNVIASFGTENKTRIIIGAHYDVCGYQEGADDNASGVVGLLELARLLSGKKLNYRIDLVAYSLEEPPYFRTKSMGSYVHAKYLSEIKADVYGMISLEMIGYFKDERKSQSYPIGLLSLIYGKTGNYITLVKKFSSGKFVRKFCGEFKSLNAIKTKKFAGPRKLAGIDFSDHLNYWKFGIDALMITDTSFYRNKNYHEATDTIETLNLMQLGRVIDSVYGALMKIKK